MALLTTVVVVMRYQFQYWLDHGAGGGHLHARLPVYAGDGLCAQKAAPHVRVDIFYRNFSPRTQAWVNSLGGIVFLMPLCAFIGFSSWNYVNESWLVRETFCRPGGIPAVFLLKSIPLMVSIFFAGTGGDLAQRDILVEEQVA